MVKSVVKHIFDCFFLFPNRPKFTRLKGFRRLAPINVRNAVYAPKCGALSTALHPDSLFNCGRVGGQIYGQTRIWLPFIIFRTARNPHGWRVFGGFRFCTVRTPSMLPNAARYQLRYTPVYWFVKGIGFFRPNSYISNATYKMYTFRRE